MVEPAKSDITDDVLSSIRKNDANIKRKPVNESEDDEPRSADAEAVGEIVQQAKHVQRVAEKIYFLSVLKRFGMAFGGILLLLGAISATGFFLLFFGIFSFGFATNVELLLEVLLVLMAVVHILAGLTLLAG
ncbi:MAG: hypothetical protein PHV13_00580 [Candidatus ainarchaeum sp.]|nr:hypothetical protein [Candidatus ainarchaeum sp.]